MTVLSPTILPYVRRLKAVGVPEKQAEVHGEFMLEVGGILEKTFATKNDLLAMEAKIEANMELKLSQLKNELIKWVFGVSIAQAAIIIACVKLIT